LELIKKQTNLVEPIRVQQLLRVELGGEALVRGLVLDLEDLLVSSVGTRYLRAEGFSDLGEGLEAVVEVSEEELLLEHAVEERLRRFVAEEREFGAFVDSYLENTSSPLLYSFQLSLWL